MANAVEASASTAKAKDANVCCAPCVVIHVLPVQGTGQRVRVRDSRLCEQREEYLRDVRDPSTDIESAKPRSNP